MVGWQPGVCERLPFFFPQRAQLSENKGHRGIQEGVRRGRAAGAQCLLAGFCSDLHSAAGWGPDSTGRG